jgi:hypothetical protein
MYKIIYLSIAAFLFTTSNAFAGINLPWSTTFNCSDWNKYSDPLNCDNISKKGAWTAEPGAYNEQITQSANYPGGAGGKGQRHWIGDGTNNNSGSIQINFNSSQKRFWMRWYQRWQAGFSPNWDTFKNVWFEPNNGGRIIFHTGRPGIGGIDLFPPDSSTEVRNVGWGSSFYTGGTSDGSWHSFEVHLDIPNKIWKLWINGKLITEKSNVDFAGASSILYIGLPSNVKNVSNGKVMYVDFDDVAISNTGYIGPIGGGGDPLSAPTGFSAN